MARGRPRKPQAQQTGHHKVVDMQRRKMEEGAVKCNSGQLDKPPRWLDTVAKKEWKRIIPDIKKIDFLGDLDLNNLAGYCEAYSNYRKATEELAASTLTLEIFTESGRKVVENPLIGIQKKYADEMRKFASLCGLTVDSRLKIGSVKVNKQEENIERRFGAI